MTVSSVTEGFCALNEIAQPVREPTADAQRRPAGLRRRFSDDSRQVEGR